MTYTIIDHGLWERYEPDTRPPGAPESAMFSRRVSDGIDWYGFAWNPKSWTPNSVIATCIITEVGPVAQAIVRDPSRLFPANGHLIEILGVDPLDTAPHKAFEGKVIDLVTGAVKPFPAPAILSVSSAQAQTALFQKGLLDLVQSIVANHPYEPVRIFYRSANTWEKANPYVQAIAEELGLNSIQLDALFEAAKKL